jgi:hypothetical protein
MFTQGFKKKKKKKTFQTSICARKEPLYTCVLFLVYWPPSSHNSSIYLIKLFEFGWGLKGCI